MTRAWVIGLMLLSFAMAGCREKASEALPPPQKLTADATGHYCGMALLEHPGPKGQIILASRSEPVWFSSARDAFSFTILAEESKDVRAVYVSDMGKAPSWEKPGADNWIDAHRAFFVIGSRKQGGMSAPETVPFSDRAAADKFAEINGGRVVSFAKVPPDYVLSSDAGAEAAKPSETSGSP
ncbi:NosL family protein [Hyphomicrobium denitrificans 1NES1]|uniref:NosL family protein n=1 Tax=Hyphomicrobium denitrificans 1NES1 TaxID=670307 RepID=N0B5P0_9HYPH|nr:NosL family protein [Hyphomicrobium denitrificans 1NES1]